MAELPPLPPYMYGREVEKNERVWSEQCMRAYAEQAVKQEREACAKLCEEIENKYWAAFKGKTQPIDRGAVYSPHVEGMSDGAGECGSAIRARSEQGML
jgi:hypothetical protein